MSITGKTRLNLSEDTYRRRDMTVEELAAAIDWDVPHVIAALESEDDADREELAEEVNDADVLAGFDDGGPVEIEVQK